MTPHQHWSFLLAGLAPADGEGGLVYGRDTMRETIDAFTTHARSIGFARRLSINTALEPGKIDTHGIVVGDYGRCLAQSIPRDVIVCFLGAFAPDSAWWFSIAGEMLEEGEGTRLFVPRVAGPGAAVETRGIERLAVAVLERGLPRADL